MLIKVIDLDTGEDTNGVLDDLIEVGTIYYVVKTGYWLGIFDQPVTTINAVVMIDDYFKE